MDLRCLGDGSWFLMLPAELLFYTFADALKQQNPKVFQLCWVEVALLKTNIYSERDLIWKVPRESGDPQAVPEALPGLKWVSVTTVGCVGVPHPQSVCPVGWGGVLCVCAWACVGWAPQKPVCVCPWELGQQPDTVFLVCVPPACQGGVWEGAGLAEGRGPVLVACQSISLISTLHPAGAPPVSPLSAQMLVSFSLSECCSALKWKLSARTAGAWSNSTTEATGGS